MMLTLILALSYPYFYFTPDPNLDANPNPYPNRNLKPNLTSVRQTNVEGKIHRGLNLTESW